MEGIQCTKGIHLGSYSINDKSLVFEHQSQKIFTVPLQKIQNSSVINKNEVVVEFPFEDANDQEDMLCEMRFFLPQKTEPKGDKGESKDDESIENVQNQAELLNGLIMNNADLGENVGDSLVTLDLPLVIPRGKYVADLYQDSMRFHGSTYNYIFKYKNVKIAFLLPKPDEVHHFFVLGLDKPLRQGNTQYPYIIMQFKKDVEESVKIKLKPEQIKEYYGDRLQEEYSGPLYEIVSKIMKALIGINIIIPGTFRSSTGQSAVKCSIKASEGYLYFLQKSLLFITKPVIYVKIEEISSGEFHRVGSSSSGAHNRLFDLQLNLKNGIKHIFVGIDKKDFNLITEYFQARKIPFKTEDETSKRLGPSISSDEESSVDESKKKMKKSEDDEDEEDDEDFIADEADGGSADDDDDDEDFDEDEDISEKKPAQKKTDKKQFCRSIAM